MVVAQDAERAVRDAEDLKEVGVAFHEADPGEEGGAVRSAAAGGEFDVDLRVCVGDGGVGNGEGVGVAVVVIEFGVENLFDLEPEVVAGGGGVADAFDEEVDVSVVYFSGGVSWDDDVVEDGLKLGLAFG